MTGRLEAVTRGPYEIARLDARLPAIVMAVFAASSGCTRWGSTTRPGQAVVVGRRPVGAPQITTTTSSTAAAGLAGAHRPRAQGSSLVVGLSGRTDSQTRNHCLQLYEVDYSQPYHSVAYVEGRTFDTLASVALAVFGVGTIVMSNREARRREMDGEIDVSPLPGILVGSASVAAGLGLGWYTRQRLPKGPRPSTSVQYRGWTVSEFHESAGCGLVPTDQARAPVEPLVPAPGPLPPPAPAATSPVDIEQRLKKLEDLRGAGLLSQEEYEAKRKAILDQL